MAFYGITRPGELLSAMQKHVLMPIDLLEPGHPALYVKIQKPKSRKRAAKVQHVKVIDLSVIQFCRVHGSTCIQTSCYIQAVHMFSSVDGIDCSRFWELARSKSLPPPAFELEER